jgi:hypothetical protein
VDGSLVGGNGQNSGFIFSQKDLASVKVGVDIRGASGVDSGGIQTYSGKIGGLSVGGSIIGGAGDLSGCVFSNVVGVQTPGLGPVDIVGDVRGAGGQLAGSVLTAGRIVSVTVGGSLIGGDSLSENVWNNNDDETFSTGVISCRGDIGQVTIRGSLVGSSSAGTGSIVSAGGGIFGLRVGGSFLGGGGRQSGRVFCEGDLGPVVIAGDMRGQGTLSGEIETRGNLTSFTLGGSLTGGLDHSGLIAVKKDSGPINIRGDIWGGTDWGSGVVAGGVDIVDDGNGTLLFNFDPGFQLAGVTVSGSLIGGAGNLSGIIFTPSILGPVRIAGDVLGGAGRESGGILNHSSTTASVTIGGSLIGGGDATHFSSGEILGLGDIGQVTIAGDVRGGAGANSGLIRSELGKIAGLSLGGSLVGGSGQFSGWIGSNGDLGAVSIRGDMRGGDAPDAGEIRTDSGNIGAVTLGGSLIGGTQDDTGTIQSAGNLGHVSIAGDVRGGSGMETGEIFSENKLASATVGGSLIGGSGGSSAAIFSNSEIGAVRVAGDVRGGDGTGSGEIFADENLASVAVGGSLIGGSYQDRSGLIDSNGPLGPVSIGGDVTGGNSANGLDQSGYIHGKRIGSVFIGGSIIAGHDLDANAIGHHYLTRNGSIRAEQDLGPVTVRGSLVGNPTFTTLVNNMDVTTFGTLVIISAEGKAGPSPSATTDLAIASLTVGGRVEFADILAGYNVVLNPMNGDAQIGAVTVGADWIASNLVAGVMATNDYFGDADDAVIPGSSATLSSKIASIKIGGQVLGTPASVEPNDHYGFVAEAIGSLKVGGSSIPLKTGLNNDDLHVGATGDIELREV